MDDQLDEGLCNMLHRIWAIGNDFIDHELIDCSENIKSYTDDGVAIRKLFIGNIAQRTTHKDLEKLFSIYGKLDGCYVRRNVGKSNYAFVTFMNMDDAVKAIKDGHRKKIHLHNRDLRVMAADSWHQPDSIEFQTKKCQNSSKYEISYDFILNEDADVHKLNNDCLMHIFSFLPIADRVAIERVCRRWHMISKQSWRTFKKLDLKSTTWGFKKAIELPFEKLNCTRVDMPILRKILLRCGSFLTHIDLTTSTDNLSNSALTIIGKLCPNLKHIDVTGLMVTSSGIKALTENCSDIVEFSLGRCISSCDNDLSQMFLKNKKLRYLKISQNAINGKCLLNLPVDSLETLILCECMNISPIHFFNAIQTLHKLHTLSLNKCVTFNDQVVRGISLCSENLKVLEFASYFPMIRKATMVHLADLVNLNILDVSMNDSVHDEFLVALGKHCKMLTKVDISSCNSVTNVGLRGITSLRNLQHFSVNYLGKITDDVLNDMPSLRSLQCRGCPRIRNGGLCLLVEESHSLELLDLSGCGYVSNIFVEVAINATLHRTNNVVLKMYVGGTFVDTKALTKVSPFLQIINVDLSEAYLRPDFEHDDFFWDDEDDNYFDIDEYDSPDYDLPSD